MKITLLVHGHEKTFSEGELTKILEEFFSKEESSRKKEVIRIEGKWITVNLSAIKQEMFKAPRKDIKQEETRKIIEEAIEIANRNQQYRNFEIQIPEKKWKTKSFREMRELARKQKSHIGNWVEVALWWATQIQKEEDWEYMCNDVENTEWYKVADWKHTLAYVGNCTSNSGKASATEVYECSYLHRIQICDAVPYLVR